MEDCFGSIVFGAIDPRLLSIMIITGFLIFFMYFIQFVINILTARVFKFKSPFSIILFLILWNVFLEIPNAFACFCDMLRIFSMISFLFVNSWAFFTSNSCSSISLFILYKTNINRYNFLYESDINDKELCRN